MVYFPARKCYHAIKISILLILVLTLISLFEHWRGGKRSAAAVSTSLSSSEEEEFGRQILEDEARIIPGLGEGGVAAHLSGEDKRLGEESEKKLAMNVYLSDRIAYNRTLKDYRNPACARVVYDAELPSVSVILIFHNEPYSVVVRTIWSVLNSARRDQPWMSQANFVERDTGRIMNLGYPGQDASSPFVYLKEIILVDDNSTLPELKGKLSHYVKTRLPPELIRILRLPDRIGLTQARQAGAREAVSDVMVFLDSHCEGAPDWIRPILQRIKDKRNAVVTPLIDVIEQDTFQYQTGNREFEGLMKARMRGARAARGDVLVFLDAHCEAGRDWLRPLLQRIRHKRDAVITPLIDVIDQTTFKLEAADVFQVGGFTFMGHFTWIDVPEREKRRRGSDIAPTWSPTMAGGLFAINRAYYWEIGAYDEQMAGWGGENLEMSFRIWQCGGTLETIPCSRVGHVFRSFHPYGLPAHTDTHGINTARMAEVWMDEYAELFYLHRPDLRNNPKIGDVTHRKVLREKLHCKSFQWYLDNIYRDKFVPVRDVYGYGRFMNPATGFCLDTMQREADLSPLGVYPCHPQLQATQYLSLSLSGELRNEEDCAQVQFNRHQEDAGELGLGRKVLMSACAKKHKSQKWKYVVKSGEVQQVESGLCLDAGFESGGDALARPCSGAARQRWLIDYADHNGFTPATPPDDSEYKAREKRLQALRGQRRISRSLFSYGEGESRRRKRKRTHKRTHKRKNKFILKLVRTLMNNSAEHLEAELRCRHRTLYPNNTFVRDIVTILNERNIKVINNGRVFSRNGVGLVRPDAKSAGQRGSGAGAPDGGGGGGGGQQKVKHSNRQKHQNTTGESNALPAVETPASGAEPQPDPEQDKRIIIEDFVEVKPLTTTEPAKRHKKKHKRKRHRVTSTPRLPLAPVVGEAHPPGGPSEGRHSPLTLLAKQMADQVEQFRPPAKADQSMEETGMVSGEENSPSAVTHTTDLEDWPLGESRFRRNNSLMQPLRRSERRQNNPLHFNEGTDLESDQDVAQNRLVSSAEADHPPAGDEHPPVKLVMRTNLTFNLDDNFFKSRTNEASEDLTISNTPRAAPPVKLLIKSDDSSGDLRGETDDNRGEYEGNRVESVQDESSGSSDSSNTS